MKYVWVVGASSGIGESLAIKYADMGYQVFISARSVETLNAMVLSYSTAKGLEIQSDVSTDIEGESGLLVAVPMDVTDEQSIVSAILEINNVTSKLHKVIINAGTCEYIDDTQVDLDLMRRVMETNVFGAIQVSNYSQALLNHKESPQLVFVSSSVTYQALPRAHAYGGSKAALRYFAECLKVDVQKQGLDVRVISPGFVKTPLTDKNDFDMPFMISSDDAADRIIKGLSGSKFDIHFPKRFTLLLKIFSCFPDSIKFNLLGKMARTSEPSLTIKNKEIES